jgi:hypothetical protein
MRANLILLVVISIWRVVLISKVISVIFHCRFIAALPLVLLFADGVALFILFGTRLPILSIMGGIRYTESERILLDVVMTARLIAILSLPVWLISAVIVASRQRDTWIVSSALTSRSGKVSWPLWGVAILSVAVWFFVLPSTQGEQRLRTRVERELRSGRLREAVTEMARHDQSDFPPYWNPPPEIGYGEYEPLPEDVLRVVSELKAPDWIRRLYEEKVGDSRLGE